MLYFWHKSHWLQCLWVNYLQIYLNYSASNPSFIQCFCLLFSFFQFLSPFSNIEVMKICAIKPFLILSCPCKKILSVKTHSNISLKFSSQVSKLNGHEVKIHNHLNYECSRNRNIPVMMNGMYLSGVVPFCWIYNKYSTLLLIPQFFFPQVDVLNTFWFIFIGKQEDKDFLWPILWDHI